MRFLRVEVKLEISRKEDEGNLPLRRTLRDRENIIYGYQHPSYSLPINTISDYETVIILIFTRYNKSDDVIISGKKKKKERVHLNG